MIGLRRLVALLVTIVLLVSQSQLHSVVAAGTVPPVKEIPGVTDAYAFSGGLARVFKYGKYAYVNRNAELATDFKYDEAWDLKEGLARVRTGERQQIPGEDYWETKNDKWGFIDISGKEVIPLSYRRAWDFNDGLAAVVDDQGKLGFIDKQGKVAVPFGYSYWSSDDYHFDDGLAVVFETRVTTDNFGVETGEHKYKGIDKTGREALELRYDYAQQFSEGMLAVATGGKWGVCDGLYCAGESEYSQAAWGFVDTTGQEVIAPVYDWVSDFEDGIALVGKNGKYGAINKAGQEIIPVVYEDVFLFPEEKLFGLESDGLWGYADYGGEFVIPQQYDIACRFREGLATVARDGRWGAIDNKGNIVVALQYNALWNYHEGLVMVRVKEGGQWGYMDTKGSIVVQPAYNSLTDFSEGLAIVLADDIQGVIENPLKAGAEEPKVPAQPVAVTTLQLTVGQPGYAADGQARDMVAACKQAGHTMVPVRMLQDLGAQFGWQPATRTATFTLGEKTVKITQDSTNATVNGQSVIMLVAPRNLSNRLMIPVRFISESLGLSVRWSPGDVISVSLP